MAKDTAIGKRLKISKAQQNMLAAVAGASFILGVSLVFAVYFLKYIKFNGTVIAEKDKAIVGYSNAIKNIGICKKPSGRVYNKSELERCVPNETELDSIPDTLRYNVIMNASQSEALESVGREGLSICYDTSTGQKLSFDRIYEKYSLATTDKAKAYYLEMIGMCSSLRVIPDALPSSANALALGASLNKIFTLSNYEPEGITPGREDDNTESGIYGLGALGVNLEIESDTKTALTVLRNLEKSIREINIESADIEQKENSLTLRATATAYYTEPVTITENIEQVRGDGKIIKDTDEEE